MKIFYVCVFLIAISFADIGDDILAQYIELSMELTKSLNGTEANEDELHQLAKDVVYYGDDQKEIQKLYDLYMENKSEEIRNAFMNNFLHARKIEYVTSRVNTILGYYLTKHQIEMIRIILERESTTGASQKEIITAVKNELAKEIGPTKADKAVDLVMKDLKIFEKKNKGWVEKTEKLFTHLITHDGL